MGLVCATLLLGLFLAETRRARWMYAGFTGAVLLAAAVPHAGRAVGELLLAPALYGLNAITYRAFIRDEQRDICAVTDSVAVEPDVKESRQS
jgi:hypothetical protein